MFSYSFSTYTIKDLFDLRKGFSTLPSCQREFIWKLILKQGLIDSILRGLPIPPLAFVETSNFMGSITKELLDGQQRFQTIISYMMGGFRTSKNFRNAELKPLFQGMLYSELPIEARTKFDNYKISVVTITGADDNLVGLTFRRWQSGMPLTLAERLYSYDGITKDIAAKIYEHPFWKIAYKGDIKRRQPFQSAIKLLIIESLGTFANLTTRAQLDKLVKQSEEKTEWGSIPERVTRRLDLMTKLFRNSEISSISHVSFIYQGIVLLEESDYELKSLPDDCFTKWFMDIRARLIVKQRNGNGEWFRNYDKVNMQRKLWNDEWVNFIEYAEPARRDPKRAADINDKLLLWNSQDGKCWKCNKDLRFRDGSIVPAHHIVGHAKGGTTTLDNMALIHKSCHDLVHDPKLEGI